MAWGQDSVTVPAWENNLYLLPEIIIICQEVRHTDHVSNSPTTENHPTCVENANVEREEEAPGSTGTLLREESVPSP